jgi:hypothetical protein
MAPASVTHELNQQCLRANLQNYRQAHNSCNILNEEGSFIHSVRIAETSPLHHSVFRVSLVRRVIFALTLFSQRLQTEVLVFNSSS